WDIGGFSGEIPALELYLRSTAMATLSPLMQYHSEGHGASEVRDRTPWNIAARHGDTSGLTIYRRFAHLRMRILELIHEDAVALSAEGLPLMRYPALAYPQAHAFLSRDPYAYLFGRDLLVAPVVDRGVGAREVLLPPGTWVDAWSGGAFSGPRSLQASAGLDRIPVFVQAGSPRLQRWLDAFAEPVDAPASAPDGARA
ncbi:MAG TPA: TIM-barrel domain-containing protein, partial [Trueperaceae bacterium]|nr:TIM-barrel domain-containing protein [Trueperaceae bacterium]